MKGTYLPTFTVDRLKHLDALPVLDETYGLLLTVQAPDHLLRATRALGKPLFVDSGVFGSAQWHQSQICEFREGRWQRSVVVAGVDVLKSHVTRYLGRCSIFSPDYVFAQDVFGQPELSLQLAQIALEEHHCKNYPFDLIGVVQVGDLLYQWQSDLNPGSFTPLSSPKAIAAIQVRVQQYRDLGYEFIALGGLLRKTDLGSRTGLTFGLNEAQLERLILATAPDFILAGLSLTRSPVLARYGVSADSTNWLWWKYAPDRFDAKNRDPLREILHPLQVTPVQTQLTSGAKR